MARPQNIEDGVKRYVPSLRNILHMSSGSTFHPPNCDMNHGWLTRILRPFKGLLQSTDIRIIKLTWPQLFISWASAARWHKRPSLLGVEQHGKTRLFPSDLNSTLFCLELDIDFPAAFPHSPQCSPCNFQVKLSMPGELPFKQLHQELQSYSLFFRTSSKSRASQSKLVMS